MITSITTYIEQLIISLGGLGVFLASVIEEIIIPIPSVLIQSGAGLFLLAGTEVSFAGFVKLVTMVALPAALGVAIGSLVVYGLVFYGGTPAIKRYGKFFFIRYEKFEKVQQRVAAEPRLFVFLTVLRFVPLFPNVLITAACGLLRVPLRPYLISTFVGIFIRALYLGGIGWMTGLATSTVSVVDTFFGRIGTLVLILAAVSFISTGIASYVYKRKKAF